MLLHSIFFCCCLSFSDDELLFQVMQYFLKIASLPAVVVLMRLCHQRQYKNKNKSSFKYIFYQTPPHTSHTLTISSQKHRQQQYPAVHFGVALADFGKPSAHLSGWCKVAVLEKQHTHIHTDISLPFTR